MLILAAPWLLLLLPLPIVVRGLVPAYHAAATGLRVPFLPRLSRLLGDTDVRHAMHTRRGWFAQLAVIASWCCVVTALARPQWLEPPISNTVPVRDLLIAVDLSSSMQTKDFQDEAGKTVDRLTAVKQVLDGFLAHRQGDRVGLIVFGNAPFVQAPFTQDLDLCRELLGEMRVGMAGPKTAFGDAIGLSLTVFEQTKVPERVLIALTDGNDTSSLVPPQKAAEIAKERQITIYTVAVGDPRIVGEDQLDEVTLKAVAETTGGTYSHATNRSELDAIYRRLDELPTQAAPTVTHRPRRDLFYVPLAACLLISFATTAGSAIKSFVPPATAARKAAA